MKRIALIVAGLAVVAALLLLVLRSGATSEPGAAAPRKDQPSQAPAARQPFSPAPRVSEPRPSAAAPARVAGEPDQSREYVNRHGHLIRDHRSGEDRPEFDVDEIKAPRKQHIEQRITQGVRDQVYDAVRGCRDSLDASAYGDKPRAQVEVLIDIDEGQVQASKAQVKLADVGEEAGTAFATCVNDRAQQLSFGAEGHGKISEYRVTLVFPLQ